MAVKIEASRCSACGTDVSQERWSAGLCPACLIELALDDTSLEADLNVEVGEAPTLQFVPDQTFSEGDIHGERYRIRSLLGRGGMGEVWRAYDLKLRLDVALKALRKELITDKHALETLRQEVRVAREVISPNVCRVFDLQEVDGQELVSMEYIDGTTLQEILKDEGPLELNKAREIASQFLAGLEAIHAAGLVHRDIKPENLMITRTGRVVVMDFGIAKGLGDGKSGMIAGTPAYMSPEQAKGGELDARADLFSAGVVLAEMVEPGGIQSFEARRKVWEGIRLETPQAAETPWLNAITKAVASDRDDRFESASALARALEEVTLRAAGDDTVQPYPGLSAFQEEDAEYFYGRELEVEALWKKLRRPHLLAVIGPSGAGKSSFLRAGLLPTLTDGWSAIITTPGNRPFASLARALAERLPGDSATVDALLRFEEPEIAVNLISEWSEGTKRGLIILDQFEELFTQNPGPVQQAFAELLGRLPLEANVYVLLSMRDDFLYHCHRYEAFQPILSDLTLLGPPTGASMRRAIVEPALRCGYRFEDELIVEAMLAEVEGERGALPMVAFSAAQLWERRDRDTGLLTRKSYEQIGGVGGALAQHAETTLEYIGDGGIPIVRELFRNLVTAQGTRAARDREELLSVFAGSHEHRDVVGAGFTPAREGARPSPTQDRAAAESVLNTLIDARLLTSYEVPAADNDDSPHQRIEIVHESLLANWPRLVRWRTQDAQGAQLRDELRSQAKLWDEHGRSEDYLWTGTAFKEYELWRERYPGGLTDTEAAFAGAMVSLAARRRRRRQAATAAVLIIALAVASALGFMWRQSESARQLAEAETLRAEAGKLLALGELEIDSYPTASLAWATKSLELTDTEEGRMMVLRALYKGPPVRVPPAETWEGKGAKTRPVFSPKGRWLAGASHGAVFLYSEEGGDSRLLHSYSNRDRVPRIAFQSGGVLVAELEGEFRWFSVPDGEELRPAETRQGPLGTPCGEEYITWVVESGQESFYRWPYEEGSPRLLGKLEPSRWNVDPTCSWLANIRGNSIFLSSLEDWSQAPRKIGEHQGGQGMPWFHPIDKQVAVSEASGEIRIWSTDFSRPVSPEPLRSLQGGRGQAVRWDPSGRWVVSLGLDGGHTRGWLWDMTAPQGAEPLILARSDGASFDLPDFHPTQPWLAASSVGSSIGFWPLDGPHPWVMRAASRQVWDLAISPNGGWLVSVAAVDGGVRAWPLRGQNEGKSLALLKGAVGMFSTIAFHPTGEHVALASGPHGVLLIPMSGGPVREMPGDGGIGLLAFSPDGQLLATVPSVDDEHVEEMAVRVWDLESDEVQSLGPLPSQYSAYLAFESERHLRWSGPAWEGVSGGERVFDLQDGSVEIVAKSSRDWYREISPSGEFMLFQERLPESEGWELFWKETRGNEKRQITSHGNAADVMDYAMDPSDRWMATGDNLGVLRVGPVSGEEPHLLIGHEGAIRRVEISPDGLTIASAGDDGTIRVWPTPDLSKPPLHTLPHDELIAKLHTLTNLRIVGDPESSTGWKLDHGPFPGWKEVPTWP